MKMKRAIVFIIILVLTVPIFTTGFMAVNGMSVSDNEIENNLRIAEELSDLSGMSKDEILDLKSVLGSWEVVVDHIERNQDIARVQDSIETDQKLPVANDEIMAELIEKGYDKKTIENAIFEVERLQSLLEEYARLSGSQNSEEPGVDDTAEKISVLSERFNKKTAVEFLLVLSKEDYKSSESIDMYLAFLEGEVDLSRILQDGADVRALLEKYGDLVPVALTMLDIEYAVIDALIESQSKGNEQKDDFDVTGDQEESFAVSDYALPDNSVEDPFGEKLNIEPISPQEKVENEIKTLNPNLNND